MSLANRPGFTLIELLIALTLTAVIGAALTSVLSSQSRFYDQQEQLSSARQVSRSATNIMMSELRMVDAHGGVLAASGTSVTVRVPYAIGLHCGHHAGLSRNIATMLPVDPEMYAHGTANFAGWAYRADLYDPAATYTYVTASAGVGNSSASTACTNQGLYAASNGVMPGGGFLVQLQPANTGVPIGTPLLLLHTITYSFAASQSMPGFMALWRTAGSGAEELVAPFDADARFRFYVSGSATAQTAAPADLTELRGIEFDLNARSLRRPATGTTADRAQVTTAVFFRNRVD